MCVGVSVVVGVGIDERMVYCNEFIKFHIFFSFLLDFFNSDFMCRINKSEIANKFLQYRLKFIGALLDTEV